jgi:hypothetical protein
LLLGGDDPDRQRDEGGDDDDRENPLHSSALRMSVCPKSSPL